MSFRSLGRRFGGSGSRRTGLLLSASLLATVGINGSSHAGPNTCAPGTCTTETQNLGNLRADDLVRAFVGQGVTYSNATFRGVPVGGGTVTQQDPSVYGFAGGIVLSTGCVENLPGPNSSPGITCSNGGPGDADLEALTGVPSFDAAILEFDFVPDGRQINFRYVFSSDEYNEWVGASFNDTFAFYVNGQNITWIPGTNNEPVQIASVNNGNPRGLNNPKHADLYRDNDVWDPALPVPTGWDTEMDGLTRVFSAQADVKAGEVNHIKIVIADLGDDLLDSNVILQNGSFQVGCADTDLDGVCDNVDNCVFVANPDQKDGNGNGIGDACDGGCVDNDNDAICDNVDNCKMNPNFDQKDTDGDGIGDACDACPLDPNPAHQDPNACQNGPVNQPPVARCANQTIYADGMCTGCSTVNAGSYDPDGDPITCTTNVGCPYNVGANVVTLTCVDTKGASSTCQGTITVVDGTPPAVSCPGDVILSCLYGNGLLNYGAASATDNCNVGPASCLPGPGTALANNTITPIACSATDASNNVGQCVFRATVVNQPPVARCAPQVVSADGACTGWADVNIGSYDPDGGPVSCTQTAGPYHLGVNEVVLTCVDSCGGTSTCNTTVTIVDDTPPTVICPPDQTLQCATTPMFSTQSADNCGNPTVVCTPGSGDPFPVGFTSDKCTAIDSSGNTASCDFQVNVVNANPPIVKTVNSKIDIYEDDTWWQQGNEPIAKACSGQWNIFPFVFTSCELEAWDGCTGQKLDLRQNVVTITRLEWWAYMQAREAADPQLQADMIRSLGALIDANACEKLSIEANGQANLPVEFLEESLHDWGTFWWIYYEIRDYSGNVTRGRYRMNLWETLTGEILHDQWIAQDPGLARTEVGPIICYGQDCPPGAPTKADICPVSLDTCAQLLTQCQQKGDCQPYADRCVSTCGPYTRVDCSYGVNGGLTP